MAKLVLSLKGTVLDQRFIDKERILVGRDVASDIVIDDPALGWEQASVVTVGGDHIFEDHHGDAGTRLNGRSVTRQILQHRDVIELGEHHLCYLNSRVAADVDLDQTMLIAALSAKVGPMKTGAGVAAIPAARTGKVKFPEGSIRVLAGAGQYTVGERVDLDRVVTTFGMPGDQLLVISRRPQGYFATHVEGSLLPRVNQKPIGTLPQALCDGDTIEAAGYRLEFRMVASPGSQ